MSQEIVASIALVFVGMYVPATIYWRRLGKALDPNRRLEATRSGISETEIRGSMKDLSRSYYWMLALQLLPVLVFVDFIRLNLAHSLQETLLFYFEGLIAAAGWFLLFVRRDAASACRANKPLRPLPPFVIGAALALPVPIVLGWTGHFLVPSVQGESEFSASPELLVSSVYVPIVICLIGFYFAERAQNALIAAYPYNDDPNPPASQVSPTPHDTRPDSGGDR